AAQRRQFLAKAPQTVADFPETTSQGTPAQVHDERGRLGVLAGLGTTDDPGQAAKKGVRGQEPGGRFGQGKNAALQVGILPQAPSENGYCGIEGLSKACLERLQF